MNKHPIIVYWIGTGKTRYYESIILCAQELKTSTSQIKRLLNSGKIYNSKMGYCYLEDAL